MNEITSVIVHKIAFLRDLRKLLDCFTIFNFLLLRLLGYKAPIAIRSTRFSEKLWIRPTSSDLWMYTQVFSEQEYRFAKQFQLQNILDLGANCV